MAAAQDKPAEPSSSPPPPRVLLDQLRAEEFSRLRSGTIYLDHAGAALFLASELSAWVTGVTLPVDGGAIAAGGFYRLDGDHWTNAPILADAGIQPG